MERQTIKKSQKNSSLRCTRRNISKFKNIFLSLIHNCGYENVTFDKEVDFRNLYNEKNRSEVIFF